MNIPQSASLAPQSPKKTPIHPPSVQVPYSTSQPPKSPTKTPSPAFAVPKSKYGSKPGVQPQPGMTAEDDDEDDSWGVWKPAAKIIGKPRPPSKPPPLGATGATPKNVVVLKPAKGKEPRTGFPTLCPWTRAPMDQHTPSRGR